MGSELSLTIVRRPSTRAKRAAALIACAAAMAVAGVPHAQPAQTPASTAPAASVTELQPRTVAQLLVTRSLELTYARDSVSIARALYKAEAALYEPVIFGAIRRTRTDRPRSAQEILNDALQNKGLFVKLEEEADALELGVRQKIATGGELSGALRTRTLDGNHPDVYPEAVRATSALVLTLRQPLLRGRGARYTETDLRVAELESQIAAWQFRQQLQKVVGEGLSLYWQAWVAAESRKLRDELVRTSTAQLDDARQRVRAGRMAERVVAEVERLRLDRLSEAVRAAQAHDEARVRLLSALNLDASQLDSLALQPGERGVSSPSTERVVDQALAQWPAYQIARLRREQGLVRLAFARDQVKPAVDVQFSYTSSGSQPTVSSSFSTASRGTYPEWSVGLNVELGAFGGRKAQAQVLAQQMRVSQSDAEIEAITSAFANDLSARLWALASAQRDLELRRSELVMRRQFLEEERRRLGVGVGLPASVMLAEDDLIESDIRVLEAIGRLETVRLSLALADGTLLDVHGVEARLPAAP
jgi:outer membrane protein TolC